MATKRGSTFKLDPEQQKQLRETKAKYGIPQAQVVREGIRRELDRIHRNAKPIYG